IGATPAAPRDVIDHLILAGAYPEALREARIRHGRLAALSSGRTRPADLTPLVDRYGLAGTGFAREPLSAIAARFGYAGPEAFEEALWRRHLLDTEGGVS
ncbi:MAG TPA: hypothetical protein PKH51_07340, partial [Candidatus Sumerlaeota bacterium]|nr:hypothetical protein [Candidatus Sumerlaeota bacterium]